MSYGRALVVCCVVGLAALACKPENAPAPVAGGTSDAAFDPYESCPVKVPATTATAINTKDGVALFFSTIGANVGEVRRRTTALAHRLDAEPDAASAQGDASANVPASAVPRRPGLVPLHATVEPTPDGARLVLVPKQATDLGVLRTYARAQADRMRLGVCPANLLQVPQKTDAQNANPAPAADTHG